MIHLYARDGAGLAELPRDAAVEGAAWIDLYRPTADQQARVEALGIQVPTLADMEEIEISNRLYRENGADYMVVVLPGQTPDKEQVSSPVAFILTARQLITVRHHGPRPFETFGARADKSSTGCTAPAHLFLGLVEEILGRQADLLEGLGRELDTTSRQVFGPATTTRAAVLERALTGLAAQGEQLSRIRLGLLTMERALSFFSLSIGEGAEGKVLRIQAKAQVRDLQALEVHADFLTSRLAFATDATLGMVNLAQNMTVRIVSVVAVLFLPPTLIASVYGMNFRLMPELAQSWGYPMALALMVGSALVTWLFFKWKHWL